ncbi:hypothetical protein CsSME_00053943 [Camellia sinensis var. sinensis]
MAQIPENIADILLAIQRSMDTVATTVAAQGTTLAELQRSSGVSITQPPPVAHPIPPPPPPTDEFAELNSPEDLRVPAQTSGGSFPLPQPAGGIFPSEAPESDPTMLKLSKLEKLFKRSQGVNLIPDIEDGYTETAVKLPERFKMPHIDRFDGSGDPMVHIRLFSDVLKPMGLTRPQKLSLFGRTLSGVAVIWYAKLEDSVKQNWEELAEAFITQYSYNTQIEVTTRDLEATRQEPNESFVAFVTKWRAKAAMMTNRPLEKDQIRMIVRNLHGKMLQKMIVLPLFTFNDLHEIGVQIEDAIKQGIIVDDKEPVRKPFGRSSNATTNSSTVVRPSEVNSVTTTTAKMADPFANASPQTTNSPRNTTRTLNPLYMSPAKAMKILIERGYLKPLDPRPLPDPLPAKHDPTKYCAFHQQLGHDTDYCFRLRHEIQNLIDNKIIAPPQPQKPNVTTNPLPSHDKNRPPPHLNYIHTLLSTFNPSIYITPVHLPKPEVYIPESIDLCMMDAPLTQPKLKQTIVVVVVVQTKEEKAVSKEGSKEDITEVPMIETGKLLEEGYDPNKYIVPVGQLKPEVILPDSCTINVVR